MWALILLAVGVVLIAFGGSQLTLWLGVLALVVAAGRGVLFIKRMAHFDRD